MFKFTNKRMRILNQPLLLVILVTQLSIFALSENLNAIKEYDLSNMNTSRFNQEEKNISTILGMKSLLNNQYSNHKPILIENNSDFFRQAKQEGWPGNGSNTHPYIIEGLLIANSSQNLITIKNTNAHFQLNNNFLDGVNWYNFGIFLQNTSNGNLKGNSINKTEYGVAIYSSANTSCIANTISNNQRKGCYISDSMNITISSNLISYNNKDFTYSHMNAIDWWNGIRVVRSKNSTFSNNTILNNGYVGIRLDSSHHNFISENTIKNHDSGIGLLTGSQYNIIDSNCFIMNDAGYFSEQNHGIVGYNVVFNNTFLKGDVGLWITSRGDIISNNIVFENDLGIQLGVKNPISGLYYTSTKNLVTNNIVFNNSIGLLLENAQENTVMNNSVYSHDSYGILINASSVKNIIETNDFLANNQEGRSQAYDNGSENSFSSNYWYEWTSPDIDEDGIVDKPYSIAGDARNKDISPKTSPNNLNSPTNIIAPPAESSPGWTIIILIPIIITRITIGRRKRKTVSNFPTGTSSSDVKMGS